MAHNIDVTRFQNQFLPELYDALGRTLNTFSSLTESPIEAMLGAAFWVSLSAHEMDELDLRPSEKGAICRSPSDPRFTKALFALTPQYAWNSYRIDWALRVNSASGWQLFFIECDGHAFHERTSEQAERDRKRDRDVQQAGIPILRFTGSEIHQNPFYCVFQILEFVGAYWRGQNSK